MFYLQINCPILTVNIQHFLKVARARAEVLKSQNIDASAWSMLEAVALAEHDGHRLCVTELMRLREHGSPATIHRRLVSLRKMGLVLVVPDEDDSRVKWLTLSQGAQALFEQLGEVAATL